MWMNERGKHKESNKDEKAKVRGYKKRSNQKNKRMSGNGNEKNPTILYGKQHQVTLYASFFLKAD